MSDAIEYMQRLNGVPRGKAFYRCGCCRAARTLKRELWLYLRPPKCRTCGSRDWRLDMSRYNEWKLRKGPYRTCHCDGLYHPHREGSSVWCISHPTGPNESDINARYGVALPAMTDE